MGETVLCLLETALPRGLVALGHLLKVGPGTEGAPAGTRQDGYQYVIISHHLIEGVPQAVLHPGT
jgi:hypothetical protein